MSHFPSLPEIDLISLWKKYNPGVRPLLDVHDEILRGPSELSEGERELIAAYVSSLNGCHFCFTAHRDHALAWHIDPGVFGDVVVDTEHDSLSVKFRALLPYVRKLTIEPGAVAMEDVEPIYAAGYSEAGLYDIITTTALYAFMNRILEGAGIKEHVKTLHMSDEQRRKLRYANLRHGIFDKDDPRRM